MSMRGQTGKEMKNLMLAVSLSVLLLVLAIIAYFMVDIIVTTNRNSEHNRQLVIDESVVSLTEMADNITSMSSNPLFAQIIDPALAQRIIGGDHAVMYDLIIDLAFVFYPVEYVGLVDNGELVNYGSKPGLDIDPDEMPLEPYPESYQTLDEFGGESGFYISTFYSIPMGILGLGDLGFNLVVDRTEELNEIDEYFRNQRNDLIVRLSIAAVIAVILSLLMTTVGLRHFTRKYVVNPIEELNRTAEEIADGTFTGEVEVNKDSAYAALQGLLRSGQKVLKKMDEELE
jgi:HAMP domain-containing protein